MGVPKVEGSFGRRRETSRRALSGPPSRARSTVDEVFNEGGDGPLLTLAEAGRRERSAEGTLYCVGTSWHLVPGQFHQSPVWNVEMCSESTKYPRGGCLDLSSLELLEVCGRDTRGDCDGLERLVNLGSSVGELSAELSRIPHDIFHGSDRTQ